jgi:hypothetical protein
VTGNAIHNVYLCTEFWVVYNYRCHCQIFIQWWWATFDYCVRQYEDIKGKIQKPYFERKSDNTAVNRKRTIKRPVERGQCPLSIDRCIVLFLLTDVLSSFYWPLYCPLSTDRFIVLFLLTAVLSSFYWPMYCPLSKYSSQ